MGYIPKSHLKILQAQVGEFVVKSTGEPYSGLYIRTSSNAYYAGNNINDLSA